jgi:NTP pyrophosphatase (non-canonical NTP hydrolase)
MPDNNVTLEELKRVAKAFTDERDWDQYHTPKDLAIGVITEASELLEHFRFKSEKEAAAMLKDPAKRREIGSELADVLYFVLRFAQKYDLDVSTEFYAKMEENAKKYPIEKSKGLNKKYTEYK